MEAEFHLLTKEEAEISPAGLGRKEPDPLDKPNRPDTSFNFFLNPFKTFRYIFWKNYKGAILKFLVLFVIVLFLAFFIYSLPGITANKLFTVLI